MGFIHKTDDLNKLYESMILEEGFLDNNNPELKKVMTQFEKDVQKVVSFIKNYNKENDIDPSKGGLVNLKNVKRLMIRMIDGISFKDIK